MTKHTKESITELLKAKDKAIERGVVAIWKYQTQHEKEAKTTKNHNNVGFTPADARIMTSLAEGCIRYGSLTAAQIDMLKNGRRGKPGRIWKYAGQLARIANGAQ